MEIKIDIKCNQEIVMKIMDCHENSPHYSLYVEYYQDLIKMLEEKIEVIAYVKTISNHSDFIEAGKYEKEILCFITLGKEADYMLEKVYAGGDYLKAMFLDNITNQILFNASSELYKNLKNNYTENGRKLTSRKVPGERGIDFNIVPVILYKMQDTTPPDVELSSANMISPMKSLIYYYGVGEFQEDYDDLSCATCEKKDCKQRLVSL